MPADFPDDVDLLKGALHSDDESGDSSDGSGDEEEASEGLCDAFTSGFKLMRNNYELGKVLLASGLQATAANLPDTFVLASLRTRIWGDHMSEYMAYASIGINAVAVLFGGLFGRFGDTVDRRIAAAVYATATFASSWSLLVFGWTTATGLWACTVLKIIGSFGNTSNVFLALVNDVTPAKDRGEAVGAFFAMNNLISLVMTSVPVLLVLILEVVPNNPFFFLVAQVILSALCYVLLWSVRLPTKEKVVEKENDDKAESRGICGLILLGLTQMVEPVKLACGNSKLRRLFWCSFLLMFCGQLVMDIGGQYFNQSLNLIPYGTAAQVQTVSVLTMIPGQLLAIPGNLITGALVKRGGPLVLLRRMIPMSACLVCIGAFMAEVRQFWFIAIVVVCLNYASLPNVPVNTLVSGSAPPNRVGEALSIPGIAGQLASLIGNAFVAFFNQTLMDSTLFDPLWIYYPICGLISLCALIPVSGSPSGGWGAAAGLPQDQIKAVTSARLVADKWRAKAHKTASNAGRR